MATLRKRQLSYYARIQWRDSNSVKKEKQIRLKTHLKSEALTRLHEVNKYEDDIKNGEDYTPLFSWLRSNGGKTKIVRRTLQDAIDEYLIIKELRNQRKSTIDRSRVGLKSLSSLLKASRSACSPMGNKAISICFLYISRSKFTETFPKLSELIGASTTSFIKMEQSQTLQLPLLLEIAVLCLSLS